MPESLYERVPVRDGLAAERTVLAAERTFLAYLRTAFAFFITGVTGSQLLQEPLLIMMGHVLTGASVLVFIYGAHRFRKSRASVREMLSRMAD